LGVAYEDGTGVEVDKKKAKHYFELAAMGGNVDARFMIEGRVGNHYRAFKHWA